MNSGDINVFLVKRLMKYLLDASKSFDWPKDFTEANQAEHIMVALHNLNDLAMKLASEEAKE